MGWASAGPRIFDPVARALIAANADSKAIEGTLAGLIGELREEDWDTEYDSLQKFAAHPEVVRAFARHGITLGT